MKKKSSVCPHRQHISLGSKWVSQMQGKGKPLKSSLQVHMQGTAEIDMHLFLSGHQLLQTQSRDSIVANRTLTAGPHTLPCSPQGHSFQSFGEDTQKQRQSPRGDVLWRDFPHILLFASLAWLWEWGIPQFSWDLENILTHFIFLELNYFICF